jgi:5-methylcytosine-specific restriction protein A
MGGIGSGRRRQPGSPDRGWRRWYGLQRWKTVAHHQLGEHPFCALCATRGLAVPATVVDHIEHHGGDWNRFWSMPLQSLCKPCHDGPKKLGYSKEIGLDGWPVDPKHPIYQYERAQPAQVVPPSMKRE